MIVLVKQNKYDEPEFYSRYCNMRRSIGGLEEAGEWPAFRRLLPDITNLRVLDLGCGFGWHCRYAVDHGAKSVLGIDLSEKMLARARESNYDPRIEYRRLAIEDMDFAPNEFDLVLSSLAFHYVEHFDVVVRAVHRCLVPGGCFIFSVEHPVFTALARQDWCYDSRNHRQHWPVDDYQREGIRHTHWMTDDVIKYHRTIETYINTMIAAQFTIQSLCEPQPDPEMLQKYPEWTEETRRPMFLLISSISR